uniref:hypothetical protein n=1 Tax=Thaumasiovibrio occultus TaxID=1891184 RepID=UPI000B35E1E8|nr:hypothetical protein [Thaumasiovibrio occultus]
MTRKTRLVFAVALLVLIASSYPFIVRQFADEYQRIPSPDGQYSLVIYRQPQLFAMPGSAGDAPGFVQLVNSNDVVLQEQPVEMVQLVDQIAWQPDSVNIKLIATWPLPAE